MNQTDNQLLRDPEISPTAEIIADGLGKANKAFVTFSGGLSEYGISLMDWRFYNDGKAWLSKGEYKWTTSRGTNKAKPIFWLSIWEGFFKVSFFFGSDVKDELLSLPLSAETKTIIQNANAMGKTARFMPVILDITNEMQLNDIFILVEFRKVKVK
jgi:hypothetical protein